MDENVAVEFCPSAISMEDIRHADSLLEGEKTAEESFNANASFILKAVKRIDVQDDEGNDIPVTVDTLNLFPAHFTLKIVAGIGKAITDSLELPNARS